MGTQHKGVEALHRTGRREDGGWFQFLASDGTVSRGATTWREFGHLCSGDARCKVINAVVDAVAAISRGPVVHS